MSELGRLIAEAARFDDDAIVALANPGLLRRGQRVLDDAGAGIDIGEADVVQVSAPGWSVTVGAGSPLTTARCTCATAGVCQHIVASILALRLRSTVDEDETADIMVGLVAIDDDTLRRWAGVGDLRWALGRAGSIEGDQVHVDVGTYVSVELPMPLPTVRFMGPTLDASIVQPAGRNDARLVALALLLLWRRTGRPLPFVEAAGAQTSDPAADAHVPELVSSLVRDALTEGLLHLSDTFVQRLDAVAATARGARWYRLGRLAERAADELDGIERRDASADSAVLLDLLSEMGVLAAHARESMQRGVPVPDGVVGTARAEYEQVGPLDLVGCGHFHWGDSVFGGTSALLLDIESSRILQVSVTRTVRGTARPPHLAWSGAHAIEALAGCAVRLVGARLSSELRLSNSATITASVSSRDDLAEVAKAAWTGEEPPASSRVHGRRGARMVVARVDDAESVRFDPMAQATVWPIRSASKDVLVRLPYRRALAPSIEALERLAPQAPTHVIGGMQRRGDGLGIEPVSLVINGRLEVLSAQHGTAAGAAAIPDGPALAVTDRYDGVAARVVRLAERGAGRGSREDLDSIAVQCSDRGLSVIADVLRSSTDPATCLVRAAWVLSEYRSLDDSGVIA